MSTKKLWLLRIHSFRYNSRISCFTEYHVPFNEIFNFLIEIIQSVPKNINPLDIECILNRKSLGHETAN